MTLKFTNTLTNKLEPFVPLVEGQVKIYCCGVTVYDLCHLGHARSYIVWDVLRRYLTWKGYKVTFVQNFTDIDDKIINKAIKEKSSMKKVSEENIEKFHEDMEKLGILKPDRMPRATQCIESIRSLIKKLQEAGSAYSIGGDVYFSVESHSTYGKLSGRDLLAQEKNADGRMSQIESLRKKNSFDFALWKSTKEGEPSFPSPWGYGRPGWHIECSAMVKDELGETIDIHLGGSDLIFPHHENEIAQSEVANGKQLARYWLHNGMVNVAGQKMSKSLGNFTTIRSLLQQGTSPMTLRLFILQAHYRKPLDFTTEALSAASKGWKGINAGLRLGNKYSEILGWGKFKEVRDEKQYLLSLQDISESKINEAHKIFSTAMDNDLNTSVALSAMFDLARPLRAITYQIERGETIKVKKKELIALFGKWKSLKELAGVLGFKEEEKSNMVKYTSNKVNENEIKNLIEERLEAKRNHDFKKADKIRTDLKGIGIELIDNPEGTEWFVKEEII